MDADRLAFLLALVFLGWWVVGLQLNRRRANRLAALLGPALRRLGEGAAIRPLGSSAFRVDLQEPAAGLQAFTLVCLLEPRDFPLAWAWMRLRGVRDRMVIKAVFRRPPAEDVSVRGPGPEAGRFRLEGLVDLTLQRTEPHLHLAFNLAPGREGERIQAALQLVRRLARQEAETS